MDKDVIAGVIASTEEIASSRIIEDNPRISTEDILGYHRISCFGFLDQTLQVWISGRFFRVNMEL